MLASLVLIVGLSMLSNVVADLRAGAVVELPEPPQIDVPQPAHAPQMPARPVFRHSVVSGGVYTPDDVEAAMARDRIVAGHYSGVNARELRVEALSGDRAVYMSYRVGNEIFWTKQKVRLQKGETILTDGVHHIRARCGNCIAFAPMEPTAEDEPDEMEFDALADDDVVQSRVPLGTEVLFQPTAGIAIPWLVDIPSGTVSSNDPTEPGAIGIPVYGYGDPADPDLSGDPPGFVLFPVGESDSSTSDIATVIGGPTFSPKDDAHDPGDPDTPGDPGDPGRPGDPVIPFDPKFPPLDNPVVPVPEPATLLLVGGGLATLAARRRRR